MFSVSEDFLQSAKTEVFGRNFHKSASPLCQLHTDHFWGKQLRIHSADGSTWGDGSCGFVLAMKDDEVEAFMHLQAI